MLMCSLYVTSTSNPRYIVGWHGPEQAFTSRSTAHATSTTSIWHHISWSPCYNNLFNLVVSLTQPSRGGRGGGLPIVGFLNYGPACKANSNARPQTDLRFARILSVWVGQWGRVRAISRMRWSCAERATASRPRTFFFANTYLFFIIDFLVHGNTSPKFD